jgi:hypothetical protein
VFAAATCPACAICLDPYCCNQINACFADNGGAGGCAGELNCVNNCYNGTSPDGGVTDAGDLCAANCQLMTWGPNAAALYMAQDNCQNSGQAGSVCNGAAATAPCQCNGGDDGGSGDDGGGSSSGSDASSDGPTGG